MFAQASEGILWAIAYLIPESGNILRRTNEVLICKYQSDGRKRKLVEYSVITGIALSGQLLL